MSFRLNLSNLRVECLDGVVEMGGSRSSVVRNALSRR
jgi:hypothetical protein